MPAKPTRDIGLDIVSVGIEYKRAAIIRVVVRAKAGRSIVPSTRSERGAVERIHRRPIFCHDRDMDRLLQPPAHWACRTGMNLKRRSPPHRHCSRCDIAWINSLGKLAATITRRS
jgi:hypothetical protein